MSNQPPSSTPKVKGSLWTTPGSESASLSTLQQPLVDTKVDEPHVASLLTSSVISGMWRPNEPTTEDDRGDRKNSTKPSEVTIAVALATFEEMRALGIR